MVKIFDWLIVYVFFYFFPEIKYCKRKDIDLCLLELNEDVIETGRVNNVLLRTICLPEKETIPGSSCFTSGLRKDSKTINAVALNLFNQSHCDNYSYYNNFETILNENQLCGGLPSNTNFFAPFSGNFEEDFGGPLVCLDKKTQNPIFTGVSSSNSFSTQNGHPGLIFISDEMNLSQLLFQN